MIRTSSFSAVIAACLASACGTEVPSAHPQPGSAEQARAPIVGGTLATGDPAVVLLARGAPGSFEGYCTGTLIAPRTVLTAAHCLTKSTAWVLFGSSETAPTRWIKAAQQIPHPGYDPDSIKNDVAVVRLESAADGVPPIRLNTRALSPADVGTQVRVVGFGASNPQNFSGSGVKREASYSLRAVLQSQFESGATGQQVCFGDSGGPAFMVPPGETVEVVAGIASFVTQPSCLAGGYHSRVDAYAAAWIEPTMKTWEMPTCDPDFSCVPGCTPVDQDCVCVADGQCLADCHFAERDPDCPADCGLNGVCSDVFCPYADADCVEVGERCATDLDCPARTCAGDPQHAYTYCSQPCDGDEVCAPFGMVCDAAVCRHPQKPTAGPKAPCSDEVLCLGGTVCAGTEGDRHCLYACSGSGTCVSATETCVTDAEGGFKYCEPSGPLTVVSSPPDTATPVTLPPEPQPAAPEPASCSAVGSPMASAPLAVLALLVIGRAGRLARPRSRC